MEYTFRTPSMLDARTDVDGPTNGGVVSTLSSNLRGGGMWRLEWDFGVFTSLEPSPMEIPLSMPAQPRHRYKTASL